MKTKSRTSTTSSTSLPNQKVKTPTPPQLEYPLDDPLSKKNQATKPGNSTPKK